MSLLTANDEFDNKPLINRQKRQRKKEFEKPKDRIKTDESRYKTIRTHFIEYFSARFEIGLYPASFPKVKKPPKRPERRPT
jgi:hypothetical protein